MNFINDFTESRFNELMIMITFLNKKLLPYHSYKKKVPFELVLLILFKYESFINDFQAQSINLELDFDLYQYFNEDFADGMPGSSHIETIYGKKFVKNSITTISFSEYYSGITEILNDIFPQAKNVFSIVLQPLKIIGYKDIEPQE